MRALPTPDAHSSFREVALVDLKADKLRDTASLRGNGRVSDAEERIEHRLHARDAVQLDAIYRQLDWKGRGMRPLFSATFDRLIWNEPSIAATTEITPAAVLPARDVALVLIRHTQRESINRRAAVRREVKDVLVTVVEVTRRVDWFEVAARHQLAILVLDADRLDPMNRVLEGEQIPKPEHQLVWQPRI